MLFVECVWFASQNRMRHSGTVRFLQDFTSTFQPFLSLAPLSSRKMPGARRYAALVLVQLEGWSGTVTAWSHYFPCHWAWGTWWQICKEFMAFFVIVQNGDHGQWIWEEGKGSVWYCENSWKEIQSLHPWHTWIQMVPERVGADSATRHLRPTGRPCIRDMYSCRRWQKKQNEVFAAGKVCRKRGRWALWSAFEMPKYARILQIEPCLTHFWTPCLKLSISPC